jgi:hypothetical protein
MVSWYGQCNLNHPKNCCMNRLLTSILVMTLFLTAAHAQNTCQFVTGASFVADDGTFLGKATNSYASDSILNEFGSYGSPYSQTSIWNKFGKYGGEFSSQSPFNKLANKPPLIIKNGQIIGHLTVNRLLSGAFDPRILKSCDF